MFMAMSPALPAYKPSEYQAKRWDAGQRRAKKRIGQEQDFLRKSLNSLSDGSVKAAGIGSLWDTFFGYGGQQQSQQQRYSQWYYSTYLPYLRSQQQGQQQYSSYPVQVPNYGYRYPTPQVNPYQPYQYGYSYPYQQQYYNPYQYGGYNYPSYGGYGTYGYSGYGYGSNLPQGDQYLYLRTAQQCVGQGGIWDAFSQSCSNPNPSAGVPPVAGTPSAAQPPSVLGYSKFAAANILNAAGWETWMVQENGGNFSPPQGYDPRRVLIWVSNGVVQRQGVG